MEVAGGGVEDDEAVGGEDLGEEAAEGAGEGGVGGVTLAEEVGDGCVGEQLGGLVEGGVEALAAGFAAAVDAELADGLRGRGVEAEGEGFDRGFAEEGELVDLGEVVVFAGEPEDGDMLAAGGGGGVLGLADGRGGLEEGEERAAEEGDLLAGDHGGGSVLEALDVGQDGAAGVEAVGLAEEGVGEAVAVGLVLRGGGGGPGEGEGVGGVPAAERGGVGGEGRVGVGAEERRGAGERRDGDALGGHAGVSVSFLSGLDARGEAPMQDCVGRVSI